MTLPPYGRIVEPCDHCPASADGCAARQRFARERCCRSCSHAALDNECPPNKCTQCPLFFGWPNGRTTPGG